MTSNELRQKFLDFFEEKGHKVISSSSLIPDNDPTVLFTTAGMQQFKPFYAEPDKAPYASVASVQKCLRTSDIEEVGDDTHLTFFEMLGNFSFGYPEKKDSYFKKEAISFAWEFLTGKLKVDKSRIYATYFKGEKGIPEDKESLEILKKIKDLKKIEPQGFEDNFWSLGTEGSPGGPTVEFYIDGIEIWNLVFNEYSLQKGKYEPLKHKGVDTGMGLERLLTTLNGHKDVYETDLCLPLIEKIEEISGKKYKENENLFRIICDHIKTAVFAVNDGILPSNKEAGYVVRRIIRRAIVKGHQLGINKNFTSDFVDIVSAIYKETYKIQADKVKKELESEEERFRKTLKMGLAQFNKTIQNYRDSKGEKVSELYTGEAYEFEEILPGKVIFDLYQTYGFPIELTKELAQEKELDVDEKGFQEEFKKHQDLSRTASAGMFKGGLADSGDPQVVKYHTAAHLLLAALQEVLGEHVHQKGSNLTADRLRLDFSHPEKLTDEERQKVEDWVNDKIEKKLEVHLDECDLETAKSKGAEGEFTEKYGDKVKVYSIGGDLSSKEAVSKEICGGPHVENTGELGHFRIKNETSSSKGVRRIKATLE